jgi:hypothetical protein
VEIGGELDAAFFVYTGGIDPTGMLDRPDIDGFDHFLSKTVHFGPPKRLSHVPSVNARDFSVLSTVSNCECSSRRMNGEHNLGSGIGHYSVVVQTETKVPAGELGKRGGLREF